MFSSFRFYTVKSTPPSPHRRTAVPFLAHASSVSSSVSGLSNLSIASPEVGSMPPSSSPSPSFFFWPFLA
jgi:hypothetical protein